MWTLSSAPGFRHGGANSSGQTVLGRPRAASSSEWLFKPSLLAIRPRSGRELALAGRPWQARHSTANPAPPRAAR